MKKILLAGLISASLAACNNASESTQNKKDSLDSVARQEKNQIDSTAEKKENRIDSLTEKKKDSLDRRDSIMRNDSLKRVNKKHPSEKKN